MDIMVESLEKRFLSNQKLYDGLSYLSPIHFDKLTTTTLDDSLKNAMDSLANILVQHNQDISGSNLLQELGHLAKIWSTLKQSVTTHYKLEVESDKETTKICKRCKKCPICVYSFLAKHNMLSKTYQKID